MKTCPACKSNFHDRAPRCPLDGTGLLDAGPDRLAARVVHGRYRLVDRRGAGTTAEVYRTHDTRTGRLVAVRLLTREYAQDPVQCQRILEHERAYDRVRPHPCLLAVLDLVRQGPDGRALLVTEWVDLAPLPELLHTGGALQPDAALEVLAQLAALLEHLHAREVLARDLRAASLFVNATDPVTVRVSVDALSLGPSCEPDPSTAQGMAPHFAVVYAAPERLRGEPGAPPADVYALAVLAFEMLTGRPVFQGPVAEVVQQHLNAPPPVLRQYDPQLPQALEALLARMLAKVPRFRPAAAEVARELQALRHVV
ncbi:MAG: serine/threonine protein kinase [Deltaproteobacteria bacterium]|nr:serine/threonine protein kinase [Deltaproteobacteria bacterium]